MSFAAAFTLAVVVAAMVALFLEVLAPDLILLAALAALVAGGVVGLEEGLGGFADPTLLAIGSLFVVAAGLRETGALHRTSDFLFGGFRRLRPVLVRLTGATALSSAFLNNTPIVAMGIPTVMEWARNRGRAPSKLLIPLSFASMLGGICTLIGTSTNLVADGLLRSHGREGLGFFELGAVGVPLAVVGLGYLVLVAPRLLPERADPKEASVGEDAATGGGQLFQVPGDSPLLGRPMTTGELGEEGVELTRVTRGAGIVATDSGEAERFQPGDRMALRGEGRAVEEVAKRLRLATVEREERGEAAGPLQFRELVIPKGSPLAGERVSDVSFPERYGAVVTGVLRHGRRREEAPGDVVLRPGDTLLLEAGPGFGRTFGDSRDFYLVGEEGEAPRAEEAPVWKPTRARWGTAILLGIVVLAVSGVTHISLAALGGAVVMVAAGFLSPGDARRAVDWSVLLVIGAALGIGRAMEQSGLADFLGAGVVALGEPFGGQGILAASVLTSMLLTLIITNNAAVALVFPVVVAAAESQGLDSRAMVVGATVGASLAFATPLGYQTNLMVYGPGGYRFTDFTRVGLPLQLLLGALAVLLIPLVWGW